MFVQYEAFVHSNIYSNAELIGNEPPGGATSVPITPHATLNFVLVTYQICVNGKVEDSALFPVLVIHLAPSGQKTSWLVEEGSYIEINRGVQPGTTVAPRVTRGTINAYKCTKHWL